jgi:serpin B
LLLLVGAEAPPPAKDVAPPDLSKRIDLFTLDLLGKLAEGEAKNTIVSPQSAFRGLAMSYVASGGQTKEELARAAHLPDDGKQLLTDLVTLREKIEAAAKKAKIDLVMANSAWLDSTYATFRKEYTQQLASFGAALNAIAFKDAEGASRKINAWISEKTQGKIRKGIDPADLASRSTPGNIEEPALVTVDALYFKADWGSKFTGAETKDLPFRTQPGQSVQTPLMHQRSLLMYSESAQFKYLELPYLGGDFTMQVLLPKEDLSIKDQVALVQEDTVAKLRNVRAQHEVDVLFPKFAFSDHCGLKDVLTKLGVNAAFDKGSADFDAMIVKKPDAFRIYISQMSQDSWIGVDEAGTTAASATTTTHFSVGCGAAPRVRPATFHADHPFLFFIVHNESRSVLFAGWIAVPKTMK